MGRTCKQGVFGSGSVTGSEVYRSANIFGSPQKRQLKWPPTATADGWARTVAEPT